MTMKKRKKIKLNDLIFNICNYGFFGIFAFTTAYPLYYILINAISDPDLVSAGQVRWFPLKPTTIIWIQAIGLKGFPQAAFTSVARTFCGVIVAVCSAAVLGYVMTKYEFKYRKICYRYFIMTMYVGAGMIPSYLNRHELGMLNSFWWIYVIPNMIQNYNLILVKTYIEGLPQALEEAAYIDGAGYLKRFFYVVVPLSKPILATIAVFTAVGEWNAYMDTIINMVDGGWQTLQSILYLYLSRSKILADIIASGAIEVSDEMARSVNVQAIKYTVTSIVLLPVICVYPFFQRYFTKGIMMGAVKG